MSEAVGTVSAMWRFPVKSMLGERVEAVAVTARGVVGDRAYALVDTETGKVASAKHPRRWPQLFQCRAEFVGDPRPEVELPAVRITLADGATVMSDAPDRDAALSEAFGRPVTLASAAPEDFTIDFVHPDVDDFAQGREPGTESEVRLGAAYFRDAGMPSAVAEGSFFDLFPISVLTTSTLDYLNAIAPGTAFDARRFRMNLIVDTDEPGPVENGWLDRRLELGGGVALTVTIPDPRCIMTTLAQDGLPRDNAVLQTLARHNRLEVAGAGRFPCAGVYAVVAGPGTITTGETVGLA